MMSIGVPSFSAVVAILLHVHVARASFMSVPAVDVEKTAKRQEFITKVSAGMDYRSREASNGMGGIGDAVSAIEALLAPIVDASPKNQHGGLDADAARYALQRLFMERHGWVIKHYDSPVEMDTPSSSVFSFREDFPMSVRTLLEDEVKDKGSSIFELSVFAAVLEELIRDETQSRLAGAYAVKRLAIRDIVTKSEAVGLIDLCMASYISAIDINTITHMQAFELLGRMRTEYHDWAGTRDFFRSTLESQAPGQEVLTFEGVTRVLWSIESNFVYWNNHQCSSYKDQLMSMEIKDSGRVRLLDFYENAMHDNASTFLESVEYLQQLGAMEDEDPVEPHVVISNYVEGPNNCVARTGYYSICCMDECADLYSHLEHALRKPAAAPAEIIPIMEGLASASMSQCRKLSSSLSVQLQSIADRNDGLVLLHGRDFAEWMHMVYPRECANTASFGPAHFLTVEEWQEETHLDVQASYDDMKATTAYLKNLEQARAGSNAFNAEVPLPAENFDLSEAVVGASEASVHISYEILAKVVLLLLALAWLPKASSKLLEASRYQSSGYIPVRLASMELSDWDAPFCDQNV